MSDGAASFLGVFFGDNNDLSLEGLSTSNPSLADWLGARIAAFEREPLAPALLPRRRGATVTWYGLAHTPRDRRELLQVLQAFVGPTYGAVRVDRPFDPADPVDVAVRTFAPDSFTVDVLPGQHGDVRGALDLYFQLEDVRPRRHVSVSRPLGRLLREFEMSVVAGSDDASAQLLAEIDATGQLSAQNVVFLRVRRLAGLRQHQAVMQLPELATILSIRRPARVTAALFESLYTTELARFESDNDPASALRYFQEHVLPRVPALFRSRQGLQTAPAIKTYALFAGSGRADDRRLVAQLAASHDLLPSERSYLESLSRLVAPAEDEPLLTLTAAIEAARLGSFDTALELARGAAGSIERAELLVRCAIEVDSLDAMQMAHSAVEDLTPTERSQITASRLYAAPWEEIERTVAGDATPPSDWLAWFERAASGASFDNALEIAERSVVEWSSEALTPAAGRSVSQLLARDLPPSALRRVKDALPHLLQFIDRVCDAAHYRELLDDLSTLLLLDDDPSVADVNVLTTLVGSLFEIGAGSDRRRELIDDFTSLHARIDSAAHLDAAIEMLDIVLTFAAGDGAPRDKAFATVIAALQRWRRRVRPDQCLIAQDLAAELGAAEAVSELVPDEADSDSSGAVPTRDALRGKTVAMYTLTESAAARARDFLLRNFDEVSVQLSSDHVATDRLANMAHSADLFVIATRSAKHAATTFIEAQRPPSRPPVYAAGKGSVSLIRAVLAAI